MAGRGVAQVILASRRGIAAAGAAGLAARVAEAGSSVTITACDAGDRADLAALWARQAVAGTCIRTVVHAAGVLDDGVLDGMTPARLAGVLGPKAEAAAHLDELAGDRVDTFVLFSSIAGAIGSPGQGNYAAANAALDAIAEDRRARGMAAVSVAWGPWAGGGMTDEAVAARAALGGIAAMSPTAAVAALGRILDLGQAGANDVTVVVADVDWARLAPIFTLPRPSPLITALPEAARAMAAPPESPASTAGGSELAARLAGLPAAGQHQLLADLVRAEAAAVLGHESPEGVEMELSFLEQGLDSIAAIRLRGRLGVITGLRLPGTVVFDYPTPAALARQLQVALSASDVLPGQDHPQDGSDRGHDGRRYVASADAVARADVSSLGNGMPVHTLSRLYEQAARVGRTEEIMALIYGLAAFQPAFSSQSELENVPPPVPVSQGSVTPGLICLPSFVGRSGAQEYVRFAGRFRGVRQVSVIPIPGFADGEPLAATQDALISVYAENIRKNVNGARFVLAGHSSGALVAHAVATRLETMGARPAALVLMDPYLPEKRKIVELYSQTIHNHVLADIGQREEAGEDARLIAMAHYLSLNWTSLDRTDIPTLLVRAQELIGVRPENARERLSWAFSSRVAVVDVPGDHFTMLGDHANTTAQAVDEWFAELEGETSDGR
jgi:thioesterase domain-containing protein/acyl carrier protein